MADMWYISPEGIKEMFESNNQYDNLKTILLYKGIIFEWRLWWV